MSDRADAPRSPRAPERLRPTTLDALAHDGEHAETLLAGLALPGQRARGVKIELAELREVDLSGSRLEDLRLTDASLTGCDLANVHGARAALSRVRIEACRMTGMQLAEAQLRDVTLSGCHIELASFARARLERVGFENCVLVETDFLEAELTSVCFERCDLSHADLRGAHLRRCELRRTALAGLEGVTNLHGAALEWADVVENAGMWAAALGLGILDGESG